MPDLAGKLVWYICPKTREARVYTAADQFELVSEEQSLDGAEVLSGWSISLQKLFSKPREREA